MALTFANIKRNVVGAQKEVICDVTFDSAYPSGGEAFVPRDIDGSRHADDDFHFVAFSGNDATAADHRYFAYDHTNGKIMIYTSGATEAANGSNQAAVTCRVLARYGQVTG